MREKEGMKSILVPVVTTEMCAQYEKKEKKLDR